MTRMTRELAMDICASVHAAVVHGGARDDEIDSLKEALAFLSEGGWLVRVPRWARDAIEGRERYGVKDV